MIMGMSIDKCADMLMSKEICIERETSGTCIHNNCYNCSLRYEQGTMGEQKEALKFAVDTMRKYQKIEQILKDIPYGGEVTVRRIQEAIEDGNVD